MQNRVQKIREMLDVDVWYHVCTELNPADIGTREAAALKFVNNDLYGPPFLKQKIETPDEKSFFRLEMWLMKGNLR